MNLKYSREQILEGVILDTADTLALETEDVTADACFFSELGGESIDVLDNSFKLTKRFGLRTRVSDLMSSWQFDANGQLSPEAQQRLEADFPHIDWAGRITAIKGTDPRNLLTIELWAEILFYSQMLDVERSVANENVRASNIATAERN